MVVEPVDPQAAATRASDAIASSWRDGRRRRVTLLELRYLTTMSPTIVTGWTVQMNG